MKDKLEMDNYFEEVKANLKSGFDCYDFKEVFRTFARYSSTNDSSKSDEIMNEANKTSMMAIENEVITRTSVGGKDPEKYIRVMFNPSINNNYVNVPKLYIPVKYENITEVLDLVYKYLIKNNVNSDVKVCASDRSDNLVVRLYNINDTDAFIEFLNSPYIQERLKETNPFIVTKNNIGVVRDGLIKSKSFNSAMAECLSEYINLTKEAGLVDKLSKEDFREYLSSKVEMEEVPELRDTYLYLYNSVSQIINGEDPVTMMKIEVGINSNHM